MTTLQPINLTNKEDDNYLSSSISVDYEVELEDLQQIVVDTYEYEQQFNQATNDWVYVRKNPIKLLLKKLTYSLDDNQFALDRIVVVGFRKDKKIRAREQWLFCSNGVYVSPQIADIVAQIPDNYHDKARAKFDQVINHMEERIQLLKRNGVKVK